MYKYMKYFHLLGLCMFMASIAVHIVVGFVPGGRGLADIILAGRQAIEISTWVLTVPGISLLIVTGAFMVAKTSKGFSQRKWLVAHIVLAVLIIVNAGVVLIPLGANIYHIAVNLSGNGDFMRTYQTLKTKESILGGVNMLFALIAIFMGTIKPKVGQRG